MMARRNRKLIWRAIAVAVPALCVLAALGGTAAALTRAPGWELTARAYPTSLPPGGSGLLRIDLYNTGAAPSNGPITVVDTLPPGLVATRAGGINSSAEFVGGWDCTVATVVTCVSNQSEEPVAPVEAIAEIGIAVNIVGPPGTETNRVSAVGGGALGSANVTDPVTISATPASFGFAGFDAWFSNADGTPDTQAGSHPYEFTVSFDLNAGPGKIGPSTFNARGEARDIDVSLPPGLIGDPNAVPQCPRQQFDFRNCSASTQIGNDSPSLGEERNELPVYNLVPPPGVPAQFGFTLVGISTFLDAGVRGGDYGITVRTNNITQRNIDLNTITIWGVPADPSHDAQRRGTLCGGNGCASSAAPLPFLTLPTSCVGPQQFAIHGVEWEDPKVTADASFLSHENNGVPTGFTGCDHLGFGPSITAAPDTSQADTPAGLTVDVKVPQPGLFAPEGIASSDIRDTKVVLPRELAINPGQAAGLVACQTSEAAIGVDAPPSCPAGSKVGTDAIETPLLKDKLEGNVYILQSDPPNLELLVAASGDGVNLKLVGQVHLDEATGQLTSTFSHTPALPFTDFKLSFSGGAQAALATPTGCGVYTTSANFTPWSSPFVADLQEDNSFQITSGPNGGACASPLPFSPVLTAGATTDQAAGFTNFSLLLQRADGQQRISTLQFKTPEGLLGMISKVPLCGEPQAAEGRCAAASQIGHTVVTSGPGPYPLVVPGPGQSPAPIYLTGSYKGAPYGLSIAVPVIAGPFNLGTIVVRARIEVDPRTARLTVTTDRLPVVIKGVPDDLRQINAVIDRPGFMFNPTNCEPMSFSGTATSTEGTAAPIASHFQVGSCQSLTFKPDFKVSTAGRTSRANGASLDVKLNYPTIPSGFNQASSQSNIRSVKVDLPKQLPSRLSTLQKACPSATFDANPAGCPAESRVGQVTATTPLLPVTLTGPAYFVSYGGAKFPELVVVLQGYGVTVDLHGETFISRAGITSSTFRQIPDVPIYSFELKLPQGKFSALAANRDLCTATLKMPTVFTAQNGLVIHQSTPIRVTGCARHRKARKANGVGKHGKKR